MFKNATVNGKSTNHRRETASQIATSGSIGSTAVTQQAAVPARKARSITGTRDYGRQSTWRTPVPKRESVQNIVWPAAWKCAAHAARSAALTWSRRLSSSRWGLLPTHPGSCWWHVDIGILHSCTPPAQGVVAQSSDPYPAPHSFHKKSVICLAHTEGV